MISISLARSLDPRFQQSFAPYEPPTMAALIKTITTDVWSPIIWTHGKRLKSHFESCSYMVLDFDTGRPSLEEIAAEMKELGAAHIIATTKSHQKAKVSATGRALPAVDRFRLILKAKEPIKDRELFEYNMLELASFFGADVSCADGARFYYPSVAIVAASSAGERYAWKDYDEDYVPETERFERRRARLRTLGDQGIPPPWLRKILDGEVQIEPGERHKTAYRIGANFAALGWDEDDAVERLMATTIGDIGEDDVRRAVNNGYRAELGE